MENYSMSKNEEKDLKEKLQARLVSEREKQGWTQEKLAEILQVKSSQTISNWETGRSIPPFKALLTLAKLYDCDLDYLIGKIDKSSHDIQFIHEKTGLSELAIKALEFYKDSPTKGNEKPINTILSGMILTENFIKLLREVDYLCEIPGYFIGDFIEDCTPYKPETEFNYREAKEFYSTRLLIGAIEEMRQPITEKQLEKAIPPDSDVLKIASMKEIKEYFRKKQLLTK